MVYVLNQAEAEQLHHLLKNLALPAIPLPSAVQLQELVSNAFWASLEKEEGRSVLFALSFLAAEGHESSQPLIFEEALDLNTQNLIKLSPALLRGQRSMGISADTTGRLKIWGTAPLPTLALTVEAVGAGYIAVRFLDRTRIILRSGRITFLPNNQSDNLLFLVNTLAEYVQPLSVELILYVEALKKVIDAMVRQGHGGTLLWVPADMAWDTSIKSIRYACNPPYRELADHMDRLTRELLPKFTLEQGDHRNSPLYPSITLRLQEIKPMIDSIGQLTAVDGATIINDDLEILAFGVMLKAEGVDPEITAAVLELGQDPNRELEDLALHPIPLSRLGGARHRSAAEFCCMHKRSLAFVASQDGSLTIFGWQGQTNRLFAIRRAELDSV